MNTKTQGNILYCGVGGQGILLASEITAYALLAAGLDATKSEVHGMAQRGGSVVAHLRYGKKVYSPLIEPGTADVMLAFEIMETSRYLPWLHTGSKVIVNNQKIAPPAVATGKMLYPENILDSLTSRGIEVLMIDGAAIGRQVGEPRAANIALVGALSAYLPISEEIFLDILHKHLPRKLDENIRAFQEGKKQAQDAQA